MDNYLRSIRQTAVSILNAGHAWDGGVFEAIGANNIIFEAVINKAGFNRKPVVDELKSTFFSGGTLAALVCTLILAVLLVAFACASICSRCLASRRKNQFGQKVRVQVQELDKQFPVPLRGLFALVCIVLLLLSLIPLILAFATNSRLHASLAETAPQRQGTVVQQLSAASRSLDSFLGDIVPNVRVDVQPVLEETLRMTKEMKNKSQHAYRTEFQEVIGANLLKGASGQLLDRMERFYYTGKNLTADAGVDLGISVYNLRESEPTSYNSSCVQAGVSLDICSNHTDLAAAVLAAVRSVSDRWNASGTEEQIKDMKAFTNGLVGTLDSSRKPPVVQRKMMAEKLRVSKEFNKNITDVFDVELNSTKFVIDSLNANVEKIEAQIEGARSKLSNSSAKATAALGAAAPRFEGKRFIISFVILLLLLLTLTYVSTASTIVLLLPSVASKKSGPIVSGVYASYFIYAIVLLFVFAMFGVTSVLQTSVCRYLTEEPSAADQSTIDRFIVPEVNDVLRALKARARADPNATDKIPLQSLRSMIGGIQVGCRNNLPLLRALDSVRDIDTSVSDSAESSLRFKEKGREILRREMTNADLSVLRDKELLGNMRNLRTAFLSHSSKSFSGFASLLRSNEAGIVDAVAKIEAFEAVDSFTSKKLKEAMPDRDFTSNYKTIQKYKKSLSLLRSFVQKFSNIMDQLEPIKNVTDVIDQVITGATIMDAYLTNQTLWTETAVTYYTKNVIHGSVEESEKISSSTTIGFLSVLAKCRGLFDSYQSAVGIPCRWLLYPLSIIWFCLGWCVCSAVLFSLFAHLSVVCFATPPGDAAAPAPKHRDADEQLRLQEKQKGEGTTDNLLETSHTNV